MRVFCLCIMRGVITIKSIVEFKNVSRYFKEVEALSDISFKIRLGEILGCIGPNGAGKTTIIRLMLGLLKPTEGSVTVFGSSPYLNGKVREKTGFMMDSPSLIQSATTTANLRYFCSLYGIPSNFDRVIKLLEQLKLLDVKSKRVDNLSFGNKQKISLARSLLHDPELLILDEPTTGLDPSSQTWFKNLLRELSREGKTIFLSSHHLEDVEELCSRIMLINKGKIVFIERTEELRLRLSQPTYSIALQQKSNGDLEKAKSILERLDVRVLDCSGSRLTVQIDSPVKPSEIVTLLVENKVQLAEFSPSSNFLAQIFKKEVDKG